MPEVIETIASPSRLEMLAVADAVARDRGIERDEVLEAMEQAIQKAARAQYGHEHDIRAFVDRRSGDIRLQRFREVVEDDAEIENEFVQLRISDAQREYPKAEIGELLIDDLPPIDFGRIAAQTAKQVIVQRVRDAERERQFEEYKDRGGEIVNGLVKRIEFGNVTVDLGRAEAVLRRDETIPRENFRNGDRVRAYIYEVRRELRGPQIFLSRAKPEFMASLFAQEVPEIYDGIIEIKAVARDPGSRAKIAVISNDTSIDPVGACVGMRGSRVQAVVGELQGEKIDIIPWSHDPATFVVNALAPAEVSKVVLDEETRKIEVVVPEDQLSLAIGRRGQNVRLAAMLTSWDIDIMTEDEESRRRQEEFVTRSQMFIDALDLEDVIAHLLVTEGFKEIEDVAYVPLEELASIEGFDESIAEELQERSRLWLAARDEEYESRRKELGVADELAEIDGLTPAYLVKLGESNIRSLDDLADLSSAELRFVLRGEDGAHSLDDLAQLADDVLERVLALSPLSVEEADAIILAARRHWYSDEELAAMDEAARVKEEERRATELAAQTAEPDISLQPIWPTGTLSQE